MGAELTKAIDEVTKMTGEFRNLQTEWEASKKRDAEATQVKFQELGAKIVEQENEITRLKKIAEAASVQVQKLARSTPGGAATSDLEAAAVKALGLPGGIKYVETVEEAEAFSRFLRKGADGLTMEHKSALAGMEKKALATDMDPSAGYMVMPTMEAGILHRLLQITPIRGVARSTTIGTDTLLINRRSTNRFTISDVSQRDTTVRNAENAPNQMYQQLRLPVYESVTQPGINMTTLEDSMFDLEAEIAADAELDFAIWEGQRFVLGSGVGEPKGYVTEADTNGGEVTTIASKFANDLNMDSIIATMYSLPSPYAVNAQAAFSRLTAGYIMTLKDGIGNYLWQPTSRDGAPSTLAGYKWFEAFAMAGPSGFGAGTFTTGNIVLAFADWQRAYRIVDRRGIRIIRDQLTQYPNVVFKMSKRVGGQVVLGEAMRMLRIGVS